MLNWVRAGVARAVASFLYQTESHDLITFAAVPVVLVLIALMAIVFILIAFLQLRYGMFSMENSPLYQWLLSRLS